MKCIICLKEDVQLTKEHIIPEALGNQSFVLNCVCKKCNSLLGDKIDSANCNNILAQFHRKENKIYGKAKKLPNPFKQGETDDGRQVRVSEDFKPTFVDKVEKTENGYHIQTSTPQQAVKIINTILKRKGRSPLSEEQENKVLAKETTKIHPEINFEFEFNFLKYQLELVKIAYEALYYAFGEKILLDKKVQTLREIIYDCIYNDKMDAKKLAQFAGSISEKELTSNMKKIKKQMPILQSVHLVSIVPRNNSEIIIMIIVEGMLPGAVKIDRPEFLDQYSEWMRLITFPDIGLSDL